MERLAIVSHNSFRAIGCHKSRSPSSPYGPAPQGSQLITLPVLSMSRNQNMISLGGIISILGKQVLGIYSIKTKISEKQGYISYTGI